MRFRIHEDEFGKWLEMELDPKNPGGVNGDRRPLTHIVLFTNSLPTVYSSEVNYIYEIDTREFVIALIDVIKEVGKPI